MTANHFPSQSFESNFQNRFENQEFSSAFSLPFSQSSSNENTRKSTLSKPRVYNDRKMSEKLPNSDFSNKSLCQPNLPCMPMSHGMQIVQTLLFSYCWCSLPEMVKNLNDEISKVSNAQVQDAHNAGEKCSRKLVNISSSSFEISKKSSDQNFDLNESQISLDSRSREESAQLSKSDINLKLLKDYEYTTEIRGCEVDNKPLVVYI